MCSHPFDRYLKTQFPDFYYKYFSCRIWWLWDRTEKKYFCVFIHSTKNSEMHNKDRLVSDIFRHQKNPLRSPHTLSLSALVDILSVLFLFHIVKKSFFFNNKPKNVIKFHLKRDFSSFPLNFRNLSLLYGVSIWENSEHCCESTARDEVRDMVGVEKELKNKKKCWKISLSYYRYYKKVYIQNTMRCWMRRAKTQTLQSQVLT